MMEQEYSESTEDSSSSSDSYESSEESSTQFESLRINGESLDLPQGLCENKKIFNEFFSYQTWLESFSEEQKQHLMNFLPTFPDNDAQEKDETLQQIFSRDTMRFGDVPLSDFFLKLHNGHFLPDTVKMRSLMKRAMKRHYKERQTRHYAQLLKEVLVSRQRLLERAYDQPVGVPPKMERIPQPMPPRIPLVDQKTKRRYYQELAAIRQEIGESDHSSSDENYPEGPPPRISKKQKRHLNSLEVSLNPQMQPVFPSLSQKPCSFDLESNVTPTSNPYDMTEDAYKMELIRHKKRRKLREDHPELNSIGITLQDIIMRSQLGKKQPQPSRYNSSPSDNKSSSKKTKKSETSAKPGVPAPPIQQSLSDSPLPAPESSASELGDSDEDETAITMGEDLGKELITMTTPVKPTPAQRKRLTSGASTPSSVKSGGKTVAAKKIKVEPVDEADYSTEFKSPSGGNLYKTGAANTSLSYNGRQVTAATLSDLDGIDMMNLPVDLDDSSPGTISIGLDALDDIKPTQELMQETHACFFSLLRDIICSTPEHRMNIATIEDRLKAWQENPISPLNDWYSLTSDWMVLLPSAIMFLCGDYPDVQPDDYVPYVDYKIQLQAYQWIGAGRDSDQHLQPLCNHWLQHRDEMELRLVKQEMDDGVDGDNLLEERNLSPPPPRCPTTWVVRPTTDEEKSLFRGQEAQRYDNPHRAFTFHMHSYESVVGPVKGIYNQSVGATKPRGHSLLVTERPNFVTILCLVRDATARLPNGEGTRSDICELLKDSQYLAEIQQESYLHSVVSGALDRLHYETDPCVKYDTKRKIWIYLHRGRTEEEFERLHQQQQGMSKTKKPASHRKPARSKKDALSSGTTTSAKDLGSLSSIAITTPQSQIEGTLSTTTSASGSLPPSSPVIPASTHTPPGSSPSLSTTSVTLATQQTKPVHTKSSLTKQPQVKGAQAKAAQSKSTPSKPPQAKVTATKPAHMKTPPNKVTQSKTPRNPRAPAGARTLQVSTSSGLQTIQVTTSPALLSGGVATGKSILSPMGSNVQLPISTAASMKTVSVTTQGQSSSPTSTMKAVMLSQQQMQAARSAASSLRELNKSTTKTTTSSLPVTQTVRMPMPISMGGSVVGAISTVVTGTTTTTVSPPRVIVSNKAQSAAANKQAGQLSQSINVVSSAQKSQQHSKPAILQQKASMCSTSRATPPTTTNITMVTAQVASAGGSTTLVTCPQVDNTAKPVVTVAGKNVSTNQGVKLVSATKPATSTDSLQQNVAVKQKQQKQTEQVVHTATPQLQQQQLLLQQQQPQTQQQTQQQQQQAKAAALAQLQQQLKLQQQLSNSSSSPSATQRLVTTMSVLTPAQGRTVTRVAGIQAVTSTVAANKPQSNIMAKVVTNLQGQVLSMESILAHQKQHGTLPQGTALRVSAAGAKPGQTSLIQIPSSTPGGAPQFAVVSQGNILSVGQGRVLHTQLSSQHPQVNSLSTSPQTVTINQTQGTKFVNATTGKPIVTNAANIRMVSATPGVVNNTNLRMLSTTTTSPNIRMSAATAANLRMLNPGGGLNLATISGKPVLLASKGQATTGSVGQNVILSTPSGQGHTVMLAPQALRGQGGAQLVLQQSSPQQLLLPPGFQGGTLNIKTLQGLPGLQGLKVIPISQATGGKGRQQVYARIISPAVRPTTVSNLVQQQTSSTGLQQNTTTAAAGSPSQGTPKSATKQ